MRYAGSFNNDWGDHDVMGLLFRSAMLESRFSPSRER